MYHKKIGYETQGIGSKVHTVRYSLLKIIILKVIIIITKHLKQ